MKKILITILVTLSVVMVAGGFITYSLLTKQNEKAVSYDPGEDFITNLSDNGSIVKIDLMLEVSNKKVTKTLEKDNYKIRDTIISVIRAKSPSDINSKESIEKLKVDIIEALNMLYDSEIFLHVYFEEIIVQ